MDNDQEGLSPLKGVQMEISKRMKKQILPILCYVFLCYLVKKVKEIKCQSSYRNSRRETKTKDD